MPQFKVNEKRKVAHILRTPEGNLYRHVGNTIPGVAYVTSTTDRGCEYELAEDVELVAKIAEEPLTIIPYRNWNELAEKYDVSPSVTRAFFREHYPWQAATIEKATAREELECEALSGRQVPPHHHTNLTSPVVTTSYVRVLLGGGIALMLFALSFYL